MKLSDLRVKIYADGADLKTIIRLNEDPLIKGFTTNPTLMRQAGVTDYEGFCKSAIEAVQGKPISFEVFSDVPAEMMRQAYRINTWGNNVYVKIPIISIDGEPMYSLIRELSANGICVNVTAVLGLWQVADVMKVLQADVPSVISIFAGRVADTGIDTEHFMRSARDKLKFAGLPSTELLWASVREPLNIYQADATGCEIITVPDNILKKAVLMQGRDLTEVCLETVRMFSHDAEASGYAL